MPPPLDTGLFVPDPGSPPTPAGYGRVHLHKIRRCDPVSGLERRTFESMALGVEAPPVLLAAFHEISGTCLPKAFVALSKPVDGFVDGVTKLLAHDHQGRKDTLSQNVIIDGFPRIFHEPILSPPAGEMDGDQASDLVVQGVGGMMSRARLERTLKRSQVG